MDEKQQTVQLTAQLFKKDCCLFVLRMQKDPNGSNGSFLFSSFNSNFCSKYIQIRHPSAYGSEWRLFYHIHSHSTRISTVIPVLSLVSKTMPSTVTRFRSCQGPSAHLDKENIHMLPPNLASTISTQEQKCIEILTPTGGTSSTPT